MALKTWMFLVLSMLLGAQEPTADELLQLGSSARVSENYETALEAWRQGRDLFPDDVRFPAALADMFYEQELYGLAAEAYAEARRLRPTDYEYANRLAESYGLLNRDQEAIQVLEEALVLFPDDWDLIQSLTWLLFKVEEFQRGVDILLDASERLGENPSAEMTLGTLYASLYDYDKSRYHYQRSIELGATRRSSLFLSIAWYNQSIVENTFFEHDAALASIQKSLELSPRASGSIALGEMQERRGDYELARMAYEEAASKDDTPLARMSLARLYLVAGDPDTAMEHLTEAENHPDPSWIYNFGLRESDWQRDLHETWADAWEQKSALLDWEPRFWPWEWTDWLWRKVQAAWEAWRHRETWRDLTWASADESSGKGNTPSVLWKSYRSFLNYPWPMSKYLEMNRAWDEARIPASPRFYAMRAALDSGDTVAVEAALAGLHPMWDADHLEEALVFLRKKGSPFADNEQLWRRNPGRMLAGGAVMGFRWSWPKNDSVWGLELWARWLGWSADGAEAVLTLEREADGLSWVAQAGTKTRQGRVIGNPDSPTTWMMLLRETHRTLNP